MTELQRIEALRAALDAAHTLAMAADDGYGSTVDIRNGLMDLLSDLSALRADAEDRDPETIADRACEARHVNGLRNYGRM